MKESTNPSISNCPICDSSKIALHSSAKDYTVSQENFEIFSCDNCAFKFTQSAPAQNDIGRYYQSEDYISHSDTNKGLFNKIYHFARDYMLSSKRQTIVHNSTAKNGKLLDIGSGTGYFLKTMKTAGWDVRGIEPDPDARKYSKEKFQVEVFENDALDKFEDQSFDAISMWHVLEHVHELNNFLPKVQRLLKDDGLYVVAVPNNDSMDGDHYKTHWAGWDVPRHLHHFSSKNMKLLMSNNGFEVFKMKMMPFDPFYISLLSEKYKTGKMRYINGALLGMRSFLKGRAKVEKASSIIYLIRKK